MKLNYDNKIDDKILTSSSVTSIGPLEYLQDTTLALKWITTSDTDEWVMIDMEVATSIDFAALAGTNLTSAAVVKIQANATDTWTAPSIDKTLSQYENIFYTNGLTGSYRYWRFTITDPTNPDGVIKVGRGWLSDTIQVRGPYISFSEERVDTTGVQVGLGMQTWFDPGVIYRMWDMSYPLWDNDEKADINNFQDTHPKGNPFIVQFSDEVGCEYGPYYVVLEDEIKFGHLNKLEIWSSALKYRETF